MKVHERILIVEDDESIARMLSLSLEQHGYKTMIAGDIRGALRSLHANTPDLIVLDLGLPDGDGKTMIKKIRSELSLPIIVISARQEEKEVIASLDSGADDYVVKPFSVDELLARIRSAQRRFLGLNPASQTMACGDLVLNAEEHRVTKGGEVLRLTPTEFNLLRYFMARRNQVLPYARILREIWGVGYQNDMQTLRTYINSLRKKIETDSARPVYIRTEMGIGYRFVGENANS